MTRCILIRRREHVSVDDMSQFGQEVKKPKRGFFVENSQYLYAQVSLVTNIVDATHSDELFELLICAPLLEKALLPESHGRFGQLMQESLLRLGNATQYWMEMGMIGHEEVETSVYLVERK